MDVLDKLKAALVTERLAKAVLILDHSQMVGKKVRITKEYSKWLENNLDRIHTAPSSKSPKKNDSYIFDKANIKKRFTGTVISSRYDEDGITLKVEFKEKINGREITQTSYLDVENVEKP